jgi:indole-3-glycerol phosphate synthase
MKKLKSIPYSIRGRNNILAELCESSNFLNILQTNLEALLQQIEKDRFSLNAKAAFAKLKQITKYDKYQKRDGAIVNKVLVGRELMMNKDMEKAIMDDFRLVNRMI